MKYKKSKFIHSFINFTQQDESGFGAALLLLVTVLVIALALASVYVHKHSSPTPQPTPHAKSATVKPGITTNTSSYGGKLFPNLSSDYQLIHQSTYTSNAPEQDFVVAASSDAVKAYVTQICESHDFTFQYAGDANTISCIDTHNDWKFIVSSANSLKNQSWYTASTTNTQSNENWVHIVSSGTPIYN